MSRVSREPVQPDNPLSVAQKIRSIIETLDNVEFGEPLDPNDPTSVTLAGGVGAGAHNGTCSNIAGSWVELEVVALDLAYTCRHNLYLDQPDGYAAEPVTGRPNVRVLGFWWEHDGTDNGSAFTGAETVSYVFETGDTVNANDIELRFYAGGNRLVDQSHPLYVTLFFVKATR